MAISRSLMNRQLRASGGIMDVTPRENFGLGSSLKKFVRKIIPNEVADIAVKAAPFVAPFNPALAAGMSGLGTFDQTGSISAGLKSGAMNYGGGQLARYAGGAGFQGNPFSSTGGTLGGPGAFRGLEGFKSGFSSPLGSETGLGKFFSNRGTQGVQGIDMATGGADGVGVIQDAATSNVDMITGGADGVGIIQDTIIDKSVVTKDPGFLKNIFDGISNQDYGKVGNTILEGSKKFGKAMFTNKDGSIDKAAVMGAIAFAGSYAEALALANDAGVDITEEEYDEAKKTEKKEEYASYLTNFFGGQKDGGRIGYEQGANELIMEKLKEDIMPDTSTEDMIMIMTDDGPKMIKRSDYEAMPGMFRDTTTSLYGDAARGRPVPEFAKGGRIGYEQGANKLMSDIIMRGEMDIDDLGIRQRPSTVLVMVEGASGVEIKEVLESDARKYNLNIVSDSGEFADKGSEIDFSSLGKKDGGRIGYKDGTYYVGSKSNQSMEDEYDSYIKEIEIEEGIPMSFSSFKKMLSEDYAKGGRVNRRLGSPEKGEGDGLMEMLSVEVDAGGDEEEENMLMAYSDAIFDRREKSALFRSLGDPRIQQTTKSFKNLDKILKNPGMFPEDEFMLREYLKLKGFKDGGRIGLKDGTDKSMLEKFLNSKLVQEGRYGLSEFLMNDPILFGTPDKFKDGKNNKRGTFKRDSSDYDKLSPEKQAYIEAFLNSDEDQLFLKPGKINFPINERMREHNKNYDEQQTISEYFPDSKINMKFENYENRAQGGRIGFKNGTGSSNRVAQLMLERDYLLSKDEDVSFIDLELERDFGIQMKAEGGIMEAKVPTGQMRENNAGVAERDYRQTGGFVPVGIKERADDVPAMLSKNEFVMTADAVRGIGNGSVEEGSKKLYNTMKQAEQVGKA